jgi:hypothetical protein
LQNPELRRDFGTVEGSAVLFVAFNAFVIVRHLASATLFLCLGNSMVIGVLIPSALVLWLYQPKTNNQSGNG